MAEKKDKAEKAAAKPAARPRRPRRRPPRPRRRPAKAKAEKPQAAKAEKPAADRSMVDVVNAENKKVRERAALARRLRSAGQRPPPLRGGQAVPRGRPRGART